MDASKPLCLPSEKPWHLAFGWNFFIGGIVDQLWQMLFLFGLCSSLAQRCTWVFPHAVLLYMVSISCSQTVKWKIPEAKCFYFKLCTQFKIVSNLFSIVWGNLVLFSISGHELFLCPADPHHQHHPSISYWAVVSLIRLAITVSHWMCTTSSYFT